MTKDIDIQPPLRGIDRSFAYQRQAPYSTPYALNVTPYDAIGQRQRLGSRMGLSKTVATRPVADVCRAALIVRQSGTTYLYALGGSSTSFNLRRYASGSWATVPDNGGSNPFEFGSLTSSYRVLPVPSSSDGSVSFFSPGWTLVYNYVGASNYVGGGNSATYLCGGYYNGTVWTIKTSRTWDDGASNTGTVVIDGDPNASSPCTAFVPWKNNLAAIFTANATVALEGNPLSGGRFVTASAKYGCLDALSWCKGPNDSLFVACNEGIVRWDSPYQDPDLTLFKSIPTALRGIDPTAYHVSMAYDQRSNALHVFVTKVSASAGVDHYSYDFNGGGWWIHQYQTDHEPFCVVPVFTSMSGVTTPTQTSFLLGCRDGYFRHFDSSVATDDSSAVTSTVWLGPFLGDTMHTMGIVSELVASLATGSGTLSWSIHAGNSAEEAYAASAASGGSGTWTAGTSYTSRPNVRCHTWFLKLTATSTKWSIEYITARVQAAGRFIR